MKRIRFHRGSRSARGGFNLVEISFTLGILSLAAVTLGPLLGVGLKTSRGARDDRASAQIARTLAEEAKQGTLGSGPVYLDDQGAACSPLNAAFVAQPVTQSAGNSVSQLALRVTPVGAPGHARVYAVVLPAGAEN
ncbi:MAG TPA: hypothetical protein VHY09_09945 [Candidatus Methylacidiphilales bacterium]|jgi:uncharacterized protein (TIGR02598 family)|nr:hypothetical protein [Candidatus Methylacidiphilales bacterium]